MWSLACDYRKCAVQYLGVYWVGVNSVSLFVYNLVLNLQLALAQICAIKNLQAVKTLRGFMGVCLIYLFILPKKHTFCAK